MRCSSQGITIPFGTRFFLLYFPRVGGVGGERDTGPERRGFAVGVQGNKTRCGEL